MHNLHLVRVKKASHKDACDYVDSYISGWGDENNWFSVGGSICEDGTVSDYDDYARWVPGGLNLESLNTMCNEALKGTKFTNKHSEEMIDSVLKSTTKGLLQDGSALGGPWDTEWLALLRTREFLNFLLRTRSARGKGPYDVLTSDGFFEHDYGEFGLTNDVESDPAEGSKTYIVLIDMHT
mgnify:CR=1 FL=1